jgi:cytochrome bd ubiquinol oxidase subunit I
MGATRLINGNAMLYEALSRIQFAFTIGFHILWPSLTIGLCLFLFICECLWLKTKDKAYISIYMFWSKIFALSFAMGVVTGIPMSFQFGTNFAKFSQFTAPILGPLLSVEILTAFFLEAVFIGVMLFGWKKVHPLVHPFATGFVMLGTHNSALWILIVNSWMQTPVGYEIIDGIAHATSWREVIFNPSMPYRLSHMLMASYIATLFVVIGVSASYLRRNKTNILARKSFSVAFRILIFLVPLQIIAGDLHGLNTLKYQPAKVAAMEGHWETHKGAPFVLFAIVNANEERNWFELKIPYAASLVLTHKIDGEVKGLKEWSKEDRPMIGLVFWSFRVMLAIGFAMFGLILWGIVLSIRQKLYDSKRYFEMLSFMIPSGFIAILAGWFVTEVGRQPWAVYGLLKISNSHSPINTHVVAFSLAFFVILYFTLLYFYIRFAKFLFKKGMLPVDGVEVYQK